MLPKVAVLLANFNKVIPPFIICEETMGFRAIFLLMFLFLSLLTVSLASQLSGVKAETDIIRVPNDFATIQEAINAAANGSTILVNNGVYHESPVVNKTLTLLGADKQGTIIEGARLETAYSGFGAGITVTADNTTVNGFTVRNWTYGIWLNPSRGTTVNGNIMTSNVYGISLDRSFNNTVSNNIVSLSIGGYSDFPLGYGSNFLGLPTTRLATTS